MNLMVWITALKSVLMLLWLEFQAVKKTYAWEDRGSGWAIPRKEGRWIPIPMFYIAQWPPLKLPPSRHNIVAHLSTVVHHFNIFESWSTPLSIKLCHKVSHADPIINCLNESSAPHSICIMHGPWLICMTGKLEALIAMRLRFEGAKKKLMFRKSGFLPPPSLETRNKKSLAHWCYYLILVHRSDPVCIPLGPQQWPSPAWSQNWWGSSPLV